MTERQEPSKRQQAILQYINTHTRQHERPPTYREIEQRVGLATPSAVSYHVRLLEEQGLVRRQEGVARGLSLTPGAKQWLGSEAPPTVLDLTVVRLPLKGDIIAGEPLDLGDAGVYDTDDDVLVSSAMLPRRHRDLFAVRVRGDSMVDALVNEGDIVIMQPVVEPRKGDMVAAWLSQREEMTLKYFERNGDVVRLNPANALYEPIELHASKVEIQGRVVLVLRQLRAAASV
jgi:repressor LexA